MSLKIKKLIEQLDTPGDMAAENVIQQLAKIGSATVPLLLEAAQNEEKPRIRKWSLEALGEIGDLRGAPVLMKALEHERMTVKLHALAGLKRMKYKKAAKKVVKLLRDESGSIRGNALVTLQLLNDKSVSADVIPVLKDPKWYNRQEACKACGHFKLKETKSTLQFLAENDERKAVRVAAATALKSIQ